MGTRQGDPQEGTGLQALPRGSLRTALDRLKHFCLGRNVSVMGDTAFARLGRAHNMRMTMPVFMGMCCVTSEGKYVAHFPGLLAEALGTATALGMPRLSMPESTPLSDGRGSEGSPETARTSLSLGNWARVTLLGPVD
jgi:hypothetical protein